MKVNSLEAICDDGLCTDAGCNTACSTRKKNRKLLKSNTFFIILLLLLSGIFIYFRSVEREQPSFDECVYAFVHDVDEYGGYWDIENLQEKVTTVKQCFSSQVNHYIYSNGRSIVHFLQQLFTGVIGLQSFYILNAIVFASTILMLICLSVPQEKRRNLFLWQLTIISIFYLFPFQWRLFLSYNYSLNYLWPMAGALGVMLLFRRFITDPHIGILSAILTGLLGLLTGWSHEAVAIPLSVGLLVYVVTHRAVFKRGMTLLLGSLWTGTIIQSVAPGNLSRFFQSSGGSAKNLLFSAANGFDNFCHLKMLWILLIVVIAVAAFDKTNLKRCFKTVSWIWYSLIAGIGMGLVVSTAPYTFTMIEFLSLILILNLLSPFFAPYVKGWTQWSIVSIITILFSFNQIRIIDYGKRQKALYDKSLASYLDSDDGVTRFEFIDKPFDVAPYLPDYHENLRQLVNYVITYYGRESKPRLALVDNEYDALVSGKLFSPENAIGGNGGFYMIPNGDYIWIREEDFDKNATYELVYKPFNLSYDMPLLLKLQYTIFPDTYGPIQPIGASQMTYAPTKFGNYRFIKVPKKLAGNGREVEAIIKRTKE